MGLSKGFLSSLSPKDCLAGGSSQALGVASGRDLRDPGPGALPGPLASLEALPPRPRPAQRVQQSDQAFLVKQTWAHILVQDSPSCQALSPSAWLRGGAGETSSSQV